MLTKLFTPSDLKYLTRWEIGMIKDFYKKSGISARDFRKFNIDHRLDPHAMLGKNGFVINKIPGGIRITNANTGKTGASECSCYDEFSYHVGIAIAFARYRKIKIPEYVLSGNIMSPCTNRAEVEKKNREGMLF